MAKKKADIAVLPLADAVLFPHMVLPMHIFEKDYIDMVDHCMATGKKLAITLQKPGFETEPPNGTVCCLGDITYNEDESLEETEGKAIVVSGKERVRIIKTSQIVPFITSSLEILPDTCSSQTAFDHYRDTLPPKLIQFLFQQNLPEKDIHLANLIVDPGHIADFVAFYFIEEMFLKMSLLEETDVCERCKIVESILDQLMRAPKKK